MKMKRHIVSRGLAIFISVCLSIQSIPVNGFAADLGDYTGVISSNDVEGKPVPVPQVQTEAAPEDTGGLPDAPVPGALPGEDAAAVPDDFYDPGTSGELEPSWNTPEQAEDLPEPEQGREDAASPQDTAADEYPGSGEEPSDAAADGTQDAQDAAYIPEEESLLPKDETEAGTVMSGEGEDSAFEEQEADHEGQGVGEDTQDAGLKEADEETETGLTEALTEEIPERQLHFSGYANGMLVEVTAPENAFGGIAVTMQVKTVPSDEVQDAVSEAVQGVVKKLRAVDITFSDENGNEVEPVLPVKVEITASGMETDGRLDIVHIDSSGDADVVAENVEKTASFEASS